MPWTARSSLGCVAWKPQYGMKGNKELLLPSTRSLWSSLEDIKAPLAMEVTIPAAPLPTKEVMVADQRRPTVFNRQDTSYTWQTNSSPKKNSGRDPGEKLFF